MKAIESGRAATRRRAVSNRVRYFLAQRFAREPALASPWRIEFDALESSWERGGNAPGHDPDGVVFLSSDPDFNIPHHPAAKTTHIAASPRRELLRIDAADRHDRLNAGKNSIVEVHTASGGNLALSDAPPAGIRLDTIVRRPSEVRGCARRRHHRAAVSALLLLLLLYVIQRQPPNLSVKQAAAAAKQSRGARGVAHANVLLQPKWTNAGARGAAARGAEQLVQPESWRAPGRCRRHRSRGQPSRSPPSAPSWLRRKSSCSAQVQQVVKNPI